MDDDGQWIPPWEGAGLEGMDEMAADGFPWSAMRDCKQPPCARLFGKIGDDCLKPCGNAAGKCFDKAKGQGFCGSPGVNSTANRPAWSGSCCKLDLEADDERSPDCANRGCIGFHCCVEDFPDVAT